MSTEADIVAGNAFRETLIDRADAQQAYAPLWRGWAIMEAFLAGAKYARAERDAAPLDLKLGDVVEFREGVPHAAEWRSVALKIVGIRIDGAGHRWVDVIEPWARPRHHGWYDGETTDIDVDHLCRSTALFATVRGSDNG